MSWPCQLLFCCKSDVRIAGLFEEPSVGDDHPCDLLNALLSSRSAVLLRHGSSTGRTCEIDNGIGITDFEILEKTLSGRSAVIANYLS